MDTIKFDAPLERAKRAFRLGLETGALVFEIDGRQRPWTWVLDQLSECDDPIPGHTCDLIGVERGLTYAGAAKAWWDGMALDARLLPTLLDAPDLSPAARTAVQERLDFVRRATGWAARDGVNRVSGRARTPFARK